MNSTPNWQLGFFYNFVGPFFTYQTFMLPTLAQNSSANFTQCCRLLDVLLVVGVPTKKNEKVAPGLRNQKPKGTRCKYTMYTHDGLHSGLQMVEYTVDYTVDYT